MVLTVTRRGDILGVLLLFAAVVLAYLGQNIKRSDRSIRRDRYYTHKLLNH